MRIWISNLKKEKGCEQGTRGEKETGRKTNVIDSGQHRPILLRAHKRASNCLVLSFLCLRKVSVKPCVASCCSAGLHQIQFIITLNPEIIVLSQLVSITIVTTILMTKKMYLHDTEEQQELTGDSH